MNINAPFKKTTPDKESSDYITKKYLRAKNEYSNPLLNMMPRPKGVFRVMVNERQEVKDILYPFVNDFIHNRLTFKKMSHKMANDKRVYLVEFFTEKKRKSNVKKPIKKPITKFGVTVVNMIVLETQEQFTREEIINTLINIIYKNRLDYLSFMFKKFVNSWVDKNQSLSLWDKISEVGHA
jgi:hypothetical protein